MSRKLIIASQAIQRQTQETNGSSGTRSCDSQAGRLGIIFKNIFFIFQIQLIILNRRRTGGN